MRQPGFLAAEFFAETEDTIIFMSVVRSSSSAVGFVLLRQSQAARAPLVAAGRKGG